MHNYWKEMYGERSNEFILGVIAGVEAYAVWKDGRQVVGIMEQPLVEVIQKINIGLGWKEEVK